jgi:hypothetical protein
VRDQKGGAFGEGKSRRKSDDLIHGHDGLFGIAAGLHADDDMLAGLECIDVRRRVGDKSGRFLTDDEGKRGTVLILALDHQQVGEIDARRFEFDPDHSRRKRRARQSQQPEAFRRAEFAADDGLVGVAHPSPSTAAAHPDQSSEASGTPPLSHHASLESGHALLCLIQSA